MREAAAVSSRRIRRLVIGALATLAAAILVGCGAKSTPSYVGTYHSTAIVNDGREVDLTSDRGITLYLYDDGTGAMFDENYLVINRFSWELGEDGKPIFTTDDKKVDTDLSLDGDILTQELGPLSITYEKVSDTASKEIIKSPLTGSYKLISLTTFGRNAQSAYDYPMHLYLYDDGEAYLVNDDSRQCAAATWEEKGESELLVVIDGEECPTTVSGGDTLTMQQGYDTLVFTKDTASVNRDSQALENAGKGGTSFEELLKEVLSSDQPSPETTDDTPQQGTDGVVQGLYRLYAYVYGDEVVSAEEEADLYEQYGDGAYINLHEDGTADFVYPTLEASGTWEQQDDGTLLVVLDGTEYPVTKSGDIITIEIEGEVMQFQKTI